MKILQVVISFQFLRSKDLSSQTFSGYAVMLEFASQILILM